MRTIFGRKFSVGLFVIMACAAAMATYHLTESPMTGYDEGILVQMADNFLDRGSLAIRTDGETFSSGAYMTTGYPALVPIGIAMRLFGRTLHSARSVMVLFTLGFLVCFYFVVERSFGRCRAILSTALMATHASLYAYGKPVMGEIPGLLYLMLFLLGLDRLARRPERPMPLIIMTSVALGLSAFTKPIFLLVLPAAGLTLLLYRKRLPVSPATVAVAAVSVFACLAVWLGTQFFKTDDFAKVLLFYRNPYLIHDVPATIIANLKRFVTEATPLYVFGLFVLWSVSIGARLLRLRRAPTAEDGVSPVEVFGFIFVLLVLTAYLRTPGFYRYFFLANAVLFLFFTSALEDVIRRIVRRFPSWNERTVARDLATAFGVLLVVAQGYRLLFSSFIVTTYGATQTAELTDYYENRFERDRHPFVYDVPEVVPFLHTTNYSQWIEVSGGGRFAVGLPIEEALARKVDTIILHDKRLTLERELLKDYHEIGRVTRYVVLGRNK